MDGKAIIWSIEAQKEFQEILRFYNQRNGNKKYSNNLLFEVKDVLETLSKGEYIGRLTVNKKTRVIVMKVYLIFYEINADRIEIMSFWDNRQDEKKRKF